MKIETDHGDDYLGLKFFRFTFRNINFNLENFIEQKASSITNDVKAQEEDDEELLDSLFGNKNESSSTKIVEEVVGEITDSDESSDDELSQKRNA
uniref:Uncharacterized protein n=1 Tax=Strongyloides venezuelensis TaxID=75913 RepID=A0A0K0FVM8_STRVS